MGSGQCQVQPNDWATGFTFLDIGRSQSCCRENSKPFSLSSYEGILTNVLNPFFGKSVTSLLGSIIGVPFPSSERWIYSGFLPT
jgi:hypothetical protein